MRASIRADVRLQSVTVNRDASEPQPEQPIMTSTRLSTNMTFASPATRCGAAARTLPAAVALAGLLLTLGACASNNEAAELYNHSRGDRYAHIDLYDQPTSGVRLHRIVKTAVVEGQSPLTSDVYMLNAEQRAAIDALKRMRKEQKDAAF